MKANKLSAKDLIEGDWVYGIFSGCPQERITMKYSICSNSFEWKYIPIPLTSEILEKNGFRIIFEGELHVSYFQDIESFHIEVNVDKIGIYQKLSMRDGLGNSVTIVECKYIHQLQHALRLCGIKKEIEL